MNVQGTDVSGVSGNTAITVPDKSISVKPVDKVVDSSNYKSTNDSWTTSKAYLNFINPSRSKDEIPYTELEAPGSGNASLRKNSSSSPNSGVYDYSGDSYNDYVDSGNSSQSTNSASSDGTSSALTDFFSNAFDKMYELSQSNNAKMIESAERQMEYQTASQAKAMEYNSSEAQKSRDWQEYMSNTAHQREVADLIKAGLNPVLSALNGNGASTGSASSASVGSQSGSQANVDTSISNMYATLISAYAAMENAQTSAQATLGAANINAAASKAINQANLDFEKNYPTNGWRALSTLINSITEGISGTSAKDTGSGLIKKLFK